MKNQRTQLFLLFLLVLASGCDSDPIDPDPPTPQTHTVFVGNQGTSALPSSLMGIDPDSGTAAKHFEMSGFLQGMALINDRLYVTGNTNSINVVNPETGEVIGQIEDEAFGTARYLAQVGNDLAYVTTQTYDPNDEHAEVLAVDLTSNTVVERIGIPVTSPDGETVSGNPEGIAAGNGKAFVSQAAFSSTDKVAVIDIETHTYQHAIDLGCTVRYLVADDDGEIVGSCSDTQEIVVIDPTTENVIRVDAGVQLGSYLGLGQDATVISYDEQENVYFLSDEAGLIVKFDPDAHEVTNTFDVGDNTAMGSLGFDPHDGRFYIGRPDSSFSANGSVTVHELDGNEVASYEAGVYPAYVSVYTVEELIALR